MPEEIPRILVIDDDEDFCKLALKHLRRAGFAVAVAHSAETGLQQARDGRYDAIVLDHYLPGHDGLTILPLLCGLPDAPPVVYLTASPDSRVAVAALKQGAADYVAKELESDFLILLEAALTNAIAGTALKRAKVAAEAEVRAARDEFKALADERALLLREANHRVSNSLQLIASLLHFQGDHSKSADVKAAMKEANSRVLAVARVHRSLYASLDVSWVNLADYLATLIHDLDEVTAGGAENAISLDAAPVQTSPDVAVAVGIVATELVLNALKHAYPNGQGPVRVRVHNSTSEIRLTVEDDGVGAANDSAQAAPAGLGRRIIAGMADKIDGEFRYERSPKGTCAILSFPVTDAIRVPAVSGTERP